MSGAVNIFREGAADFEHGSVGSIGGTAVALSTLSGNFAPLKGIQILADPANGAGVIYVGKSDVTANSAAATDGYPLYAGNSIFIPLELISLIYFIGSTSGLKIFWLAT